VLVRKAMIFVKAVRWSFW